MKINKILVPMDFSKCAVNALRITKTLAVRLEASIEMVTAIETPHPHPEVIGVDSVIQPLISEYTHQIDSSYKELIEREQLELLDCNTRKYNSSYQNAIYSTLEEGNIDLVISGTKTDHGIFEKLLGGKTADLISISKVPVLVIPENITALNIKKIGLSINFDEPIDLGKLEVVKALAITFEAKLNILFISKIDSPKFIYDDQKVKLADYFNGLEPEFTSLRKTKEAVSENLNQAIELLNIDILFMLPKNKKFFDRLLNKSITKEMAMKSNIPLLTVHE
ncbi:MAG: universal stress protein [Reichenbachiella sp.]